MRKLIVTACLYTLITLSILSGIIAPFIIIKLIDMVFSALHLA